jgi:hypothetical protein
MTGKGRLMAHLIRVKPDRRSGRAGWDSPVPVVRLWHALADGTPLCRCARSRYRPRHRYPGRLARFLARNG